MHSCGSYPFWHKPRVIAENKMTDVTMEWLMDAAIDPQADVSLARMTITMGGISEAHHHANCCETIHVLSGHIKQGVGDDWLDMKPGDTCLIPMGIKHQTKNMSDNSAVMMVAYSAGERIYIKD